MNGCSAFVKLYNLSVLESEGKLIYSDHMICRLKNSMSNEAPIYVSVPFTYQVLEILIAYFSYKVEAFSNIKTLLAKEVATLLTLFYEGAVIADTTLVRTIDISDNREIWLDYKDSIIDYAFLGLNNEKVLLKIQEIARSNLLKP